MKRLPLVYSACASLCLISACSPASTTPVSVLPSPQQSASKPMPAVSVSPVAQPGPTVDASERPAVSPVTPVQSTAPVVQPSQAMTPEPTGTAVDISVAANTTFNGKVFDLNGSPLDDVKIEARSLSEAVPYNVEAKTVGGTYTFNDAPAGVQIEIIASKEGFATRRRVEVLKSNKNGVPASNRYDFGTDGTSASTGASYNALTDSPEVISVTPERNSSGVEPQTSFVLSFSKPMVRESVEKAFTIRALRDVKLTVDAGASGQTFSGDNQLSTLNNTLIWDKNNFTITWNAASTQVTFSFKDDAYLPTDKDTARVPVYQIVFNGSGGRTISGIQGGSRNSHHFRLTDSDLQESVSFNVAPDLTIPYLAQMTAQTAENGGANGDAIQIVYSEPLILYTQARRVAGGLEDRTGVMGSENRAPASHPDAQGNATARNTAKNYQMVIAPPGGDSITMSWYTLGGSAIYDGSDASRRTVLLLPPVQGALNAIAAGTPLNHDVISATALLKNGSTVTLPTLPIKLQTTNAADHVANTVNLLPSVTESLQIVYTDGSRDINVDVVNPAANTYTALRNALGDLTAGGAADWTINTQQSGGGIGDDNVEVNDRVNLTLSPTAMRNNKQIAWIEFSGGIFASTGLNMNNYIATTTPLRALQASLNAGLDSSGGRFNISEADGSGTAGVLGSGDNLTLSLGANPVVGTKAVMLINIAQSGLFSANRLNTPAGGYIVYPNTAVNSTVNLYPPGSTVFVSVATSVMDPAGNTLDSSRNTQTATST